MTDKDDIKIKPGTSERFNADADGLTDDLLHRSNYPVEETEPTVEKDDSFKAASEKALSAGIPTVAPEVVSLNETMNVPDSRTPISFDLPDDLESLDSDIPPLEETEPTKAQPNELQAKQQNSIDKLKNIAKSLKNRNLIEWDYEKILPAGFKPEPSSQLILKEKLRTTLYDVEKVDLSKLSTDEKNELISDRFVIPADNEVNMGWVLIHSAVLTDNEEAPLIVDMVNMGREATGTVLETFGKALKDETAEPRAGFVIGDNDENANSSQIGIPPSKTGQLVGKQAFATVRNALSCTGYYRVNLAHSGVVAIVTAPSVQRLMEFYYKVDESKAIIGRHRGGITYGVNMHIINSLLIEMFHEHLDYISLKEAEDINVLKDVISPLDMHSIAIALASALYPDGVSFSRMSVKLNGMEEVIKGRIYLPDTEIVLNSRLTTKQKQHLIKAQKTKMDVSEVKAYQRKFLSEEEFDKESLHLLKTTPGTLNGQSILKKVYLRLAENNITRLELHGERWNSMIEASVADVLAANTDERTRQGYIFRSIRVTALREYSHLINAIVTETVDVDGNIIGERAEVLDEELVFNMLDEICADATTMSKAIELIGDFVAKNIKVVYGTPAASKEEAERNKEDGALFEELIPLNPITTFFTIAVLKFQEHGVY